MDFLAQFTRVQQTTSCTLLTCSAPPLNPSKPERESKLQRCKPLWRNSNTLLRLAPSRQPANFIEIDAINYHDFIMASSTTFQPVIRNTITASWL